MTPPLAVFFSLLCLIPRISGSARANRVSASDIDPLYRLNHTVSENSSYAFLSSISPGFFLELQISRHTSLVKVYGHKCAGASLYGVHLACGSDSFEMVDGYDPSIPASLDTQPSCIFSLSIDPREISSLELHNLYDWRFGEYGMVTFSFAEYIPRDEASNAHLQMCGHHLDCFNNTSTLLPRDGDASISTNPSQPHSVIGDKINILIGLLTALIVIILAMIVVLATYVLRLRRQAMLLRYKKDPEVRPKKNQNDPHDGSIALESAAATETVQSRPRDQAGTTSKHWLLEGQQSTVYTDPTSSLSTRVEITKPLSESRSLSRNDPPTSPPKEPVPEVPKVSVPLPTLPPLKSEGKVLQISPILPNFGRMRTQRAWSSSGSTAYPTDEISPVHLAEPHNPDNLMGSRAGSIRPVLAKKPRSRFSKPLPEFLPEIPLLSLSLNNQAIAHVSQSSGSSNGHPRYFDLSRQHAGVHEQTIRGSTTTRVGFDNSNQLPLHPKLERIKELQQEAWPLHQDQSKCSLEHETDITASDDFFRSKDAVNLHDQERLKQSSQRIKYTRVQKNAALQDNAVEKARLSFQLPADPEAWLNLLWEQEELLNPVKNNDSIQTEVRQIMRPRASGAGTSLRRARRSARIEINQQHTGKSKPAATLTQHPRHEEATSSPKQDAPVQTNSPRRALPKPPI